MIIGQPKTLEEVKPLIDQEIVGLVEMTRQLLASGQPLDMPCVTLSGLDWARIARTVQMAHQAEPAAAPATEAPASSSDAPTEPDTSRLNDLLGRFGV